MSDAYELGSRGALEKFGATRGLKEIRKAVSSNDLGRADRLARAPGVLSSTNAYGSQLQDLGRGGEGLATMVAHPQHGLSVRKLYDPSAGVYSPQLIERKEQLGSLPGAANFLGSATTQRNTPVHFTEYVHGRPAHPLEDFDQLSTAKAKVHQAGQERGFHLADLRADNARVTPAGDVRFIDYAAVHPSELNPNWRALKPNMLPVTDQAAGNLLQARNAARQAMPQQVQAPQVGTMTGQQFAAGTPKDRQAVAAKVQGRRGYSDRGLKQFLLGGETPAPFPQALQATNPNRRVAPSAPSSQPPPLPSESMHITSTPPPLSSVPPAPVNVPSNHPAVMNPTVVARSLPRVTPDQATVARPLAQHPAAP